jgi:hypothetical protein
LTLYQEIRRIQEETGDRRAPYRGPHKIVFNKHPQVPMERFFEMPRRWTFQMPKLRHWIESRLEGQVLNLFGGVTKLTVPFPQKFDIHGEESGLYSVISNDLNEDLPADLRIDAYDLSKWTPYANSFDTVVFDPPYSAFQAVKTYGRKAQLVSHARDVVEFVLRGNGRVLSLGFNSTGMSGSRGFDKEAICLVNCGGSHNDIILLSERRRADGGSAVFPDPVPAPDRSTDAEGS